VILFIILRHFPEETGIYAFLDWATADEDLSDSGVMATAKLINKIFNGAANVIETTERYRQPSLFAALTFRGGKKRK
jgi:hypothetical protein